MTAAAATSFALGAAQALLAYLMAPGLAAEEFLARSLAPARLAADP